jgi:spore germination cell wall hydrolase CwlJ-like protein
MKVMASLPSATDEALKAGDSGESIAAKGEVNTDNQRAKTPAERLGLFDEKSRAKSEKCLAEAVYFEARGEAVRGQIAVAQVVMNRAFSGFYPSTVCGVVYQNKHRHLACQFTFACDRVADVVREPDMWDRAKKIAKAMLDGQLWLPEVAKSTHYHAYWVRPSWVNEMKKMYKFGVHTFYRPRKWGDGSERRAGATRRKPRRSRQACRRAKSEAELKGARDPLILVRIISLDVERDVEIRRGVRQRARRDVVDAGCGDLRDRIQRDAAGGFQHDAAAGDLHRLASASRYPCCRASPHRQGRCRAPRAAAQRIDLDLDLDEMAGMAARALQHRRTPPATAMWLSLIRIASSSPKRWLKPPPHRTAYFSSARRPGRRLAGAADAQIGAGGMANIVSGKRGYAGQPADKIQRGALAGQHGARRA